MMLPTSAEQVNTYEDLLWTIWSKTFLQRLCNKFENLREVRCDRESF
jgi:hypothetical protein